MQLSTSAQVNPESLLVSQTTKDSFSIVSIAKKTIGVILNKTESKFSPRSRANPFLNLLKFIKLSSFSNLFNFTMHLSAFFQQILKTTKITFKNHETLKTDIFLRIFYKIYISMLRFQLYKGVKYFSTNYKDKFQSREFMFEIPLKRRQIFTYTPYTMHYEIYISMLQFQLYDGNNKNFQSGQFKFVKT